MRTSLKSLHSKLLVALLCMTVLACDRAPDPSEKDDGATSLSDAKGKGDLGGGEPAPGGSRDYKSSINSMDWSELERAASSRPDSISSELARAASKWDDNADAKNYFVAMAVRRLAPSMSAESLVEVAEANGIGQGKGQIYSSLFGVLGKDLGKFSEVLGEMPPSSWRGAGFQSLYKKKIASANDYAKSLRELKSLSEPEDLRGAALGVGEARRRLVASDKNLESELAGAESSSEIPDSAMKLIMSLRTSD